MEAQYLLSHLREQLAREAGELGLDLELVGDRVRICGVVSTPQQRALIERIVRAASDGHEVVNQIRVEPPARAEPPEHLA